MSVAALVTQPDRPQGRKQEIIPAPIKRSAEARGIPVFQPEDVNAPESLEHIRALGPELLVTAAYGQILSADLLSIPRLGGINLHGSVLPSYRGASPVARAIQNGDTTTGVTVIRMTPRIDAGGIIAIARTEIGPDETAGELEERLARLGAPLVAQCDRRAGRRRGPDPPPGEGAGHPGPQAPQGGRADRLVPAREGRPRPRPRHAALAGRLDDLASPGRRLAGSRPGSSSTRPGSSTASGRPGEVIEAAGDRLVVAAGEGAVRLAGHPAPGQEARERRRVPPRPPGAARRPHGPMLRPNRRTVPERNGCSVDVDYSRRAGPGDWTGPNLD